MLPGLHEPGPIGGGIRLSEDSYGIELGLRMGLYVPMPFVTARRLAAYPAVMYPQVDKHSP